MKLKRTLDLTAIAISIISLILLIDLKTNTQPVKENVVQMACIEIQCVEPIKAETVIEKEPESVVITQKAEKPKEIVKESVIETRSGTNDYNLYNLVNNYRQENGLSSLIVNQWLCDKAQIRSEQIKTDWSHDKFHNMPNKFGSFNHVGENLAKDWNSDSAIMNAWIGSQTHKNNMLNNWTHTCVVRNGVYIVQWFGK